MLIKNNNVAAIKYYQFYFSRNIFQNNLEKNNILPGNSSQKTPQPSQSKNLFNLIYHA